MEDEFILDQFGTWVKQLPDEWKDCVIPSVTVLCSKFATTKSSLTSIKNVAHLENLVKAGPTSNLVTVNKAIDKANTSGICAQTLRWLTCKDSKPPADFEATWEEARKQMMDNLQKEKQQIAKMCVIISALQSAVVILIEFHAIWSIWNEIQNAENVIESCKKEFPEIESELKELKEKADQLNGYIEEYLRSSRPEDQSRIRDLANDLVFELGPTSRKIGNVQFQIKGKITRINDGAKDQLKHGVSNFAQGIGNAAQLLTLGAHLTNPYMILQSVISATFIGLTIGNGVSYCCCQKTLERLRSSLEMINLFENEIQRIEQIIRKAKKLSQNQS